MSPSHITHQISQIEPLRCWVEAETGMDFSGKRIERLQSALDKVLSRHKPGLPLDRLLATPQHRGPFLERLAAELTVGESFFFRNEHHFQGLREHVLPEIFRANSDQGELRIWSAGCAAGEEAYSLAILLDQILGRCHNWRISILGSDLNQEFLARAREAFYRTWSFRLTNIHHDHTYFSPERDGFRLTPRLREMVRFLYLNLVKDVYPSPLTGTLGLDLILFRNVAIYLNPDVVAKVMERFYHALRPGGWLLLGEAEAGLAPKQGFEAKRIGQATFHQKSRDAKIAVPLRVPTDRLVPVPVLADWFVQSRDRQPLGEGSGTQSGRGAVETRAAVDSTLPDWVPLPKQRAAHKEPGESVLQQIERLLAEGKLEEVESCIQRIPDRKQRAQLWLRLAQGLLASSAVSRARQQLARCLADEPLMLEAHLLQASFAEEAGDLKGAEQAYRRALYVDRDCPIAHFHLALALHQKGDTAGAERSITTMLKLIQNKNPHELVEYGEGVCFGRLREMARIILNV